MLKNIIWLLIKNSKITPTIIGAFILLYSLLPFCMGERFVFPNQIQIIVIMAYIAILVSGYLLFRTIRYSKNREIRISNIDIILFIYAIYNICLNLFHYQIIQSEVLFESFSLFILYILFRSIKIKHIIYLLFIFPLVGSAQIVYGIKNQANDFDPGYGFSDITGIFNNSGLFGGFIAIVFVLTVGIVIFFSQAFFSKYKNKLLTYLKFTLILVLVVLLIQLLASNSRAAWCACLAGVLYLIVSKLDIYSWFSELSRFKKWFLTILSIALMYIFSSWLYGLKNKSADGRVLIWKISSKMIGDTPLFGRGSTGFQSGFMEYQAAYFKTHTQSPLSSLADDNIYAFNEFIRIWVEQGIIGLLLSLILVYFLFFNTNRGKREETHEDWKLIIIKASLLSVLIFGLFSYPMNVFQFNLVIVFFIAAISSLSLKKVQLIGLKGFVHLIEFKILNTKVLKIGTVLIWFIIAINLALRIYNYADVCKQWNTALKDFNQTNPIQSISILQASYPKLKNNGVFLSTYGKALNLSEHYTEAVPILLRANLQLPSATNYIELGKSYKATGQYEAAKNAWYKASDMIPAMFTPHYLTAKMYWQIGKKTDAQQIANDLLRKEVKIRSPILYNMLVEMDSLVKIRQ